VMFYRRFVVRFVRRVIYICFSSKAFVYESCFVFVYVLGEASASGISEVGSFFV